MMGPFDTAGTPAVESSLGFSDGVNTTTRETRINVAAGDQAKSFFFAPDLISSSSLGVLAVPTFLPFQDVTFQRVSTEQLKGSPANVVVARLRRSERSCEDLSSISRPILVLTIGLG
jgi:hypothetical protein